MSGVDLLTFLLTRIGEDEQAARAADDDFRSGRRQYNGGGGLDGHFARWIPPRVLLEAGTKRRLIEAIQTSGSDADVESNPFLRMLALPYQDHPDYRREWARP